MQSLRIAHAQALVSVVLVLFAWSALASAASLYVTPSGDSASNCDTIAAPCTLARALTVASTGGGIYDTIDLSAGNYDKDSCGLSVNVSDITIKGPSFSDVALATASGSSGAASAALIDCEDSHRFIEIRGTLNPRNNVVFADLIVRNTHYNGTIHGDNGGVRGGAFNFVDVGDAAAPITLRNVHVANSIVTGGGWSTTGACLNVQNSHVKVQDSSFTDCVNTDGRLSGAIYISASSPANGKLTMTDCDVVRARGDVGGSVLTEGSQNSEFLRVNFIDSYAAYGGVIDSGNDSNSTFTECTFIRPSANEGAVYYAYGQAGTRFTNCYSEDSYAKMNGGVFFFSSQTSPVIDGWHGVNSTAVGDGGIMRHTPGVHVTIRNSVFEGSRAGRQSGIFSMGGRGMRAENVLIKDSVATLGEASLLSFGDVISNLTLDNTEGRTSALKFHYTGQDQADTSVVAGSARDIKVINSRGLTKGVIEVQQDFPNCMSISELAVRNSNGYTGGIFVGDDACINVDGLEMTDNIATHAGSIFYSSLSSLPSSIRNARFDRNRAESASGISTSGCAGTGLPSGGIFLNNGAAPTSASVGSCPSWITSPISLQNVTFADSYAEGAGALFYIDATVDDPTGSTACSLDSFCGNANCTATNSSAASYGNTIAGPPRSLILGSSGAVSAELTTRAVIPSRPIQLTFTLRDGFGSMIHGGLPTGTDVIVLRSNLTDATRTAAGSVCYPDCAPYSSDSSSIDVFDFVIDALPGSSVPVRFYTSPATTEVDVVFTMKDCDDDKTWSALHKQCIISSCPVGQYVSFASPTSLPSCSACPANCSERRFWTYSVQTTCSAEKVSRDVLFSYIGDTEGVCRTTTQKPSDTLELISSCGVGGDLPAPLSVDCDYMTASSAKIAVSVIAAICLLLAVVMIVLLVALKPSGGRHSMFSRAYNVSSCAGIVIAVLPVFTIFDGEQLTDTKCVLMFAWPLLAFLLVAMPMWTKMCYVHRVLVNRNLKSIKHISSIMNSAVVSGIIVALGIIFVTMNNLRSDVVLDFGNAAGVPIARMECVSDNENQALVILLVLSAIGMSLHGCQMALKLRKLIASVPDIFTIGLAYFWMTASGVTFVAVYLLEATKYDTEQSFVVYSVGLIVTLVIAAVIDSSMPLLKTLGVDVEKFIIKVAPMITEAQSSAAGSTGAATTSFESTPFKSNSNMSAEQQEEHFKLMQQIATENQVLKLQVVKLTQRLEEYTNKAT